MAPKPELALQLPPDVVSAADVARLRRELEAVDEKMHQESLREDGKAVRTPRLSAHLQTFFQQAKLDVADEDHRKQVIEYLNEVLQHAPSLHVSFAREPSAAFMTKFVAYMREHIHPLALVTVGLQPTIAAGCILRTPNHQYDLSLRKRLADSRPELVKALQTVVSHE